MFISGAQAKYIGAESSNYPGLLSLAGRQVVFTAYE